MIVISKFYSLIMRMFAVCSLQLWLIGVIFIGVMVFSSKGDTVHLMSFTCDPYYANTVYTTQFSCLLSNPDTGVISDVLTGRHVPKEPYETSLTLPEGSTSTINADDNYIEITLPAASNHLARGVYYCEASNRGLTTRVPVTIFSISSPLEPANGHFTVTTNVGESASLSVKITLSTEHCSSIQHIGWKKGSTLVQEGGTTLNFTSVSIEDAGVYYTSCEGRLNWISSSIRLIVRACPAGKWGPPSCNSECDNCYNGGICDDKTGECVCRPGFTGPNCLTACSSSRTFGWNCEHQSDCIGGMVCMPDPVGCSCMSGYRGERCKYSCSPGSYGANCDQSCHCDTGSCDIYTGVCLTGSCEKGYTGINCQTIGDLTTKTTSAMGIDMKTTVAVNTIPPIEDATSPKDTTTTAFSRNTVMRVSTSASISVSDINISAGPEPGSVIIEWKMSENSEISFYYIRYWKANEEENVLTQIKAIDGVFMYTFNGLDTNSRYHFQVQAETTTAKGDWSEIYVFTVPSGNTSQPLGTNTVLIASIAAVVVIVLIFAFLIAYRLKILNSNNMKSRTEDVQGGLTGIPMSHHDHDQSGIHAEHRYGIGETADNASGYYIDFDQINAGNTKNPEYQTAIIENKPRGFQNSTMFTDRGQTLSDDEHDYENPDERNYQELDKKDIDKMHEYQGLGRK